MKVNFRIESSNKNLGAQIEKEWEEKMTSKPTVTPDVSPKLGMHCIVEDWSTRIFPSHDDILTLCHEGNLVESKYINNSGCAFLRQGKDGVFECHGHNKMPIIKELDALPKDDTVKRGCDKVLNWNPRFGCRFVGT